MTVSKSRELALLQHAADNFISEDPDQTTRLQYDRTNETRMTRSRGLHMYVRAYTRNVITPGSWPPSASNSSPPITTGASATASNGSQGPLMAYVVQKFDAILRRMDGFERRLQEVDNSEEVARLQDSYNEVAEENKQLNIELQRATSGQRHPGAAAAVVTVQFPELNSNQVKQEVQDPVEVEDDRKPPALSDHDFCHLRQTQTPGESYYRRHCDSDGYHFQEDYVLKSSSSKKRIR